MNYLKHNFHTQSRTDLLQFLKIAKEVQSNILCDMDEYRNLKRTFPLDNELKSQLKSYIENDKTCIEITESDDENMHENQNIVNKNIDNAGEELSQILTQSSLNESNKFNTEDIVYAIKENLDTRKKMPAEILENLNHFSPKNLEVLFTILCNELSLENVQYFWIFLEEATTINEFVVNCYLRLLFLKKIKTEYCDEVQQIFCSLGSKYSILLKKELTREMLENLSKLEEQKILFQYVNTLDDNFKSSLLREFLMTCEKLQTQHIPSIDILLHSQLEYDLLCKLVELMSNCVTDFASDKSYGKLVLKIVKLLGKRVSELEQPLKHILGFHKSIWKKEIAKYTVSNFEDTLTQF